MKKLLKLWPLILLPFLLGTASYNPGIVAGRYTNGGSASASGVITTKAGLLTGCEFYNGNAATRTLQVFDSATVPADATQGWDSSHLTGWKVFVVCPATTECFWGMNGPQTSPQGASGVNFANGISWANSSTIQTKTIGSADSTIACSYQN